MSPVARPADRVAEMVWPAVAVRKSAPDVPASAERPNAPMVWAGATVSTVALLLSAVVVALPALSVAVTDRLRLGPSTLPAVMT